MPKIFEVGGCVRDEILGVKSKDIDFTFVLDDLTESVETGFDKMNSFLEKEGFKIFLSTPECFTIRAMFPENSLNKGLVADFVMARKEVGLIKGTRRQILELGTLNDDLIRRDFTCNAIAKDIEGNIIDPFNGIDAIKSKILDTPLDPKITFLDDPLRMIRAIRFSITKEFSISDRVLEAMKDPELINRLKETVSKERIREELTKAFSFDSLKTFRILSETDKSLPGFLDVIIPEDMTLIPSFKKIKK